jgi:hypothetical protein
VERRQESRFKISRTITVKVLHHLPGPSLGKYFEAEVVDVSGSGMRLLLPFAVPCGAPVEIRDESLLILGEVCHCAWEQGNYAAGIRVMQTLGQPEEERVAVTASHS